MCLQQVGELTRIQCYAAWLGYYNGLLRKIRWDKEELVHIFIIILLFYIMCMYHTLNTPSPEGKQATSPEGKQAHRANTAQ